MALKQPSQPCEWIGSVPKTLIQYPSVVRAPSRHQKAPPTSSKPAKKYITKKVVSRKVVKIAKKYFWL